jgi:hypothetical protein
VAKIIQILFQVILCLLLELLQEQAKRFFQLIVLLAPGQLTFLLVWLRIVFRPLWVSVVEPVLRPFVAFILSPMWLLVSLIFRTFGSGMLQLFKSIFSPLWSALSRTALSLLSPLLSALQSCFWSLISPVWSVLSGFSDFWTKLATLLMAKIRENLRIPQLLYNLFLPLVNGLGFVLRKYIDWVPVPFLRIVSTGARLIFGTDSEEETALVIVLSFTLAFYFSVIACAYLWKLVVLLASILFTHLMGAEEFRERLPWFPSPSTWKPNFETHETGAMIVVILVLLTLFIRLCVIIPRGAKLVYSFGVRFFVTKRSPPHRSTASSSPPPHPSQRLDENGSHNSSKTHEFASRNAPAAVVDVRTIRKRKLPLARKLFP